MSWRQRRDKLYGGRDVALNPTPSTRRRRNHSASLNLTAVHHNGNMEIVPAFQQRRVPAAAPAQGTSIGQPPSLLRGADEPRWRASQRMSWHLGSHVNSQVWMGAGSWLSHQAQGNLGSAFLSCRGDAGKASACLPLSSLALPPDPLWGGEREGTIDSRQL